MGNKNTPPGFVERRSTPRTQTPLFKVMLTLNVIGWVSLGVALILFHFARPDFISGVQSYWGVEGKNSWSPEYVRAMLGVLQLGLGVSLVSIVIRARRSRRRGDTFGSNLIVLAVIAAVSLITIVTTFDVFK